MCVFASCGTQSKSWALEPFAPSPLRQHFNRFIQTLFYSLDVQFNFSPSHVQRKSRLSASQLETQVIRVLKYASPQPPEAQFRAFVIPLEHFLTAHKRWTRQKGSSIKKWFRKLSFKHSTDLIVLYVPVATVFPTAYEFPLPSSVHMEAWPRSVSPGVCWSCSMQMSESILCMRAFGTISSPFKG